MSPDEVAQLINVDVLEIQKSEAFQKQALQQKASVDLCAEGLRVLCRELASVHTSMKKDLSKVCVHVRSQHQNMQVEILKPMYPGHVSQLSTVACAV